MARDAGAAKTAGASPGTSAPGAGRAIWREGGPVRIGVSSCLLGRAVRWDGGHKRDAFLTEQLAPFVEWVPVCPELELGMGVPREPIRLVERAGEQRLVAESSGTDWSRPMEVFARRRVRELAALGLSGYVLKQDSPSCGLERVRVWTQRGVPERRGRGVFAQALLAAAPALPVVEEARLADPRARAHWIEQVFGYRRVRSLFARRWTHAELVAFHAAHELQLLSHAPRQAGALGRLVAGARRLPRAAVRERYLAGFLEALRQPATPRRQLAVLRRLLRALRPRLDARDHRELAALVDDYGRGLVPRIVPITLLRHHAGRLGLADLAGQVYLEPPDPRERMLRDRV